MFIATWLWIAAGAGAGALLRWRLSVWLNPVFPTLPLGTLASNLLGGLLMGILMEYFARNAAVPANVRLGLTTGFLGGLTTFSTFSAETTTLLLRDQLGYGFGEIAVHLIGSLTLTATGIYIVRGLALLV